MKRHVKRVAFLVILLVLSLVVLEVAVRTFFPPSRFLDPNDECFWIVRLGESQQLNTAESDVRADPLLGWRTKPFHSSSGVTTNSLGFRGSQEFELAKPEGTRRIVAIGDSFTYGYGLADEETYCAHIRRSTPGLEVINMGVNGYGTDQQLIRWRLEGRNYRPDVVLLGFFVPDFHRNHLSVREGPKPRFALRDGELHLENSPVPTVDRVLAERLQACSSTSRAWDFLKAVIRKTGRNEPEPRFRVKQQLAEAILREFNRSVLTTGARLAVVVIPHPDFHAYPDHERIEAFLETLAAEMSVPLINLTPDFRSRALSEPEPPCYGDHGHWTPTGSELAGQKIVSFLNASGLL